MMLTKCVPPSIIENAPSSVCGAIAVGDVLIGLNGTWLKGVNELLQLIKEIKG